MLCSLTIVRFSGSAQKRKLVFLRKICWVGLVLNVRQPTNSSSYQNLTSELYKCYLKHSHTIVQSHANKILCILRLFTNTASTPRICTFRVAAIVQGLSECIKL